MHLLKPQPVREADAPSPASVFAEKYDWLLRWALHFTQNDAALAEDLVQDTFMRLIMSWPRIKDNIHQVEAFLYSTLRYAHLMELRRGRRMILQDIELIEFDDLQQTLREGKNIDPIEVQDNLRRIVAFLCWRKRIVKSASVLLLRFFHGYLPDEIARIAIVRQRAANDLLRMARQDVKAYMADPDSVELIRHGKIPELMPRQIAVPQESFEEELRSAIFAAYSSPCPSHEQWRLRYHRANPQPLSAEWLGHLVSCRACLRFVCELFNFPPHGDGIVGFSSRAKSKGTGDRKASPEEIRRSIQGGMERFRKHYEHYPRALMIVVHGDVVAMRDINSASSELKVQVGPEKPMGIVEVLSEQGIPMLTLYAPSLPPEAPPQLRDEVFLSDDRRLELTLSFTSEGVVVDMHYSDPLFGAVMDEASEPQPELEERPDPITEIVREDSDRGKDRRSIRWRRFLLTMAQKIMPEFNPLFVTATVFAVASVVCFFVYYRTSPTMKAEDLLTKAVASQLAPSRAGVVGVAVQTVRIQTAHRNTERMLYHDIQNKRHVREQAPTREDALLRTQLEIAGVRWDDPLAADSFRDWHDHVEIQRDSVRPSNPGLLTLTTTVSNGPVSSESLTVRTSDFHPVDRKIELRDAGVVEIAEVNYSVFPWSAVNPDIFEPLASGPEVNGSHFHASLLPHLPRVTPVEMDIAELSARLVLNRLGQDANSRIEISRGVDGVHVQGIVDTETQKNQLQAQLRLVPHVLPSILTVREMANNSTSGSEITSIRQSSEAAEAPSSLERYFTERGLDRKELSPVAQELVEASFAVKHETEQVATLLQRFSTNTVLPNEARTALGELLVQHKTALLAALGREERALMAAQLIERPSGGADDAASLRGSAEKNLALCVELTSGSERAPRSAQIIAPQLANSIAELRAKALQISITALPLPPPPGNAGTASKND